MKLGLGRGVAQFIECLLSTHKPLGSIVSCINLVFMVVHSCKPSTLGVKKGGPGGQGVTYSSVQKG